MPQPIMTPAPGDRLLGFVGDRVRFALVMPDGTVPAGWRALLRTDLGRAAAARDEVVAALGSGQAFAGASWHDIPLTRGGDGGWTIELPLADVGFFRAKAYAVDARGQQHWPAGADVGLSVHPDSHRTANTIYCAFVRAFGESRRLSATRHGLLDDQLAAFDRHGWSAIPPSGTLRDLTQQLPHIIDTLGCRIIHLLPVNPTPTTYARYGRFGSPYAATDFTAIDPALVVFDKRTTAVDQFRELSYAVHVRGAQLFIDLAINHTGWGSTLMNEHPEWFQRNSDGTFHSPGAWGTTWEDLVELDHRAPALWRELAEVFLVWCRRGVDGFRCDAGYMVPVPAWQFITATVRQEFPATIFLLEGLGGAWSATEALLTAGGMQWAYSELFQNYAGPEVATYLDHAQRQAQRVGVLVNYSETHDNERLAKGGRAWSLLRNRLNALTSTSGGFGFTCGVEWLAAEKVEVHQSRGLNWGAAENIVGELGDLTRLLAHHPCFFDGARLTRVSAADSPVYLLHRRSQEGLDELLIAANTDIAKPHAVTIPAETYAACGAPTLDLLARSERAPEAILGAVLLRLAPGECLCLSPTREPRGLAGEDYRRVRAQAAWALTVISEVLSVEDIGAHDWRALAALAAAGPLAFVAAVAHLERGAARRDLLAALTAAGAVEDLPPVVPWSLKDLSRVTLVPPGHWLLVRDAAPFSATLAHGSGARPRHLRATLVGDGWVACFPPAGAGDARLLLERFATDGRQAHGAVRFLDRTPDPAPRHVEEGLALLTNGIGGMARLGVDFGTVHSKYDCLLGANLHPSAPSDRHVLAKRARLWVNADGFITALDRGNLASFTPGPPARWTFIANAGDRRTVTIQVVADMLAGRNTTVLRLVRPDAKPAWGVELPAACDVRLIMRVDLEDRSFHAETTRSDGADRHFSGGTRALDGRAGFTFAADDRRLVVACDRGAFHGEAEWCLAIPHPVEATRGQTPAGDAWSPGWFEIPLAKGESALLSACADRDEPDAATVTAFEHARATALATVQGASGIPAADAFGRALTTASDAYVVRRDRLKTVIAGYPWFLDWGRDSLICARGLLAAGRVDEVRQLLVTFGRFEQGGTLPNFLSGDDASNRDTSDAPLWYGVVCADAAALVGEDLYATAVDGSGRTIADVLRGIAAGYLAGTANGIRVDPASGLVWSPSHFTWMDTNHPAGTPRAGYPIEIQALWIRLLRQLEALHAPVAAEPWWALADRATRSLDRYWLEDRGWYADLLIAPAGVGADAAVVDNALRSNQLIPIALGLVTGERARRCVAASARYLVVPGALRSLAPLPVTPHLAVHAADGRLLNDPAEPYWGRYEGDEDTRRKPAYHNGTAWTWTFPIHCEALARAWHFAPGATATARALLGSMDRLLAEGCIGQIPEVIDGDAPHAQRGCDAQAWGVTEALRVWKLLGGAQR